MGLLGSITALVLALLGTPLFIVIAASGLLSLYLDGIDSSALFIELYKLARTPSLPALPLFALAGYILAASKAPPSAWFVSPTPFWAGSRAAWQ